MEELKKMGLMNLFDGLDSLSLENLCLVSSTVKNKNSVK